MLWQSHCRKEYSAPIDASHRGVLFGLNYSGALWLSDQNLFAGILDAARWLMHQGFVTNTSAIQLGGSRQARAAVMSVVMVLSGGRSALQFCGVTTGCASRACDRGTTRMQVRLTTSSARRMAG